MDAREQKHHVPFVDLASQHSSIMGEINEATERVLRGTDFILGREVDRLEEEFAAIVESVIDDDAS